MNHILDVDDPFEEAFPIAIDAATRFCRGRSNPDSLCLLYHCLWPRLRRIGVIGSSWLHAANYIDTFRQAALAGRNRILVSGSADYSLVSFILHAFRSVSAEPEITVLDLCHAPLMLNRWYAERHNCQITTVAEDLLLYDNQQGFDFITTDNFLVFFELTKRKMIADKWNELLRPAGRVVTAQRISPGRSDETRSLTEAAVMRRISRIRKNAQRHAGALDVTEQELLRDAARYYKERVYASVNSVAEVCQLFESNGFEIESVASAPRRYAESSELASPSRHSRRVYFVAEKTNVTVTRFGLSGESGGGDLK